MMEEKQASMMQYMREMMAVFMRSNGPSESSSTEGNAAVRGSPRGVKPTAVRGNNAQDSAEARGSLRGAKPTAARPPFAAAAAAGSGARGDASAARETPFREDASRDVRMTGRRGAAGPVEVGLYKVSARSAKGGWRMGVVPRR